MDTKQHLYYALGILAYVIARSDGKVQTQELLELQRIINEEMEHNIDFRYAEIIFAILNKEGRGVNHTYDWAMNEFKNGQHYLTEELVEKFKRIMTRIAASYPPTTSQEQEVLERFQKEAPKLITQNPL